MVYFFFVSLTANISTVDLLFTLDFGQFDKLLLPGGLHPTDSIPLFLHQGPSLLVTLVFADL